MIWDISACKPLQFLQEETDTVRPVLSQGGVNMTRRLFTFFKEAKADACLIISRCDSARNKE